MTLGFDATPLLGQPTGIGRYVAALADRLSHDLHQFPDGVVGTAFTRAPLTELARRLPDGLVPRGRRIPASLLHLAWSRYDFPSVRRFSGPLRLFHATNFVLPPVGSAAGVLTVHDLSYLRYPDSVSAASRRYAALVPRGIARAQVICTLTQAVADEVADEYGIAADRIMVTPPGVDDSWFSAAPLPAAELLGLGLAPDSGAGYLVAVGTVEPRKNLPLLIRAHRQLLAADPAGPELVLAGPPGWGPELGLLPTDRVLLGGYLPTATLQGLVAGARGLVFPSRYEGFGLPPLEALACGVPAIVADSPVSREVLGEHAIFVGLDGVGGGAGGGSVCDLAAAMAALPVRAERSTATAAAGRQWARQHTWDRCTDAILAAYTRATV